MQVSTYPPAKFSLNQLPQAASSSTDQKVKKRKPLNGLIVGYTANPLKDRKITKRQDPFSALLDELSADLSASQYIEIISNFNDKSKKYLIEFIKILKSEGDSTSTLASQMETTITAIQCLEYYPNLELSKELKKIVFLYAFNGKDILLAILNLATRLSTLKYGLLETYLSKYLHSYLNYSNKINLVTKTTLIKSNLNCLLFFPNLEMQLERLSTLPLLIDQESLLLFTAWKWPFFWGILSGDPRGLVKEITDETNDILKKGKEIYRKLKAMPDDWETISRELELFKSIAHCAHFFPNQFGSITQWFFAFSGQRVSFSFSAPELYESVTINPYKKTFEIIFSFFSGDFLKVTAEQITQFLEFTQNDHALLAGMITYIPHMTQEAFSNILLLSKDKKFVEGMRSILAQERYAISAHLNHFFSKEISILKRLLLVFRHSSNNFDLFVNAYKIKDEQGLYIGELLRTEPVFQIFIGKMLNFVNPSNKKIIGIQDDYPVPFDFSKLKEWYSRFPHLARALMPLGYRYPQALNILMQECSVNPQNSIAKKLVELNLESFVMTQIFRILERGHADIINRALAVSTDDISLFKKLVFLAARSQIPLAQKILSFLEQPSAKSHPLGLLLLRKELDFSKGIGFIKELMSLLERSDPTSLALLSNLHLIPYKILKAIMEARSLNLDEVAQSLITSLGKAKKSELDKFYLLCAEKMEILLIFKLIRNQHLTKDQIFDINYLEFVYGLEKVMRSQIIPLETIALTQQFCTYVFRQQFEKTTLHYYFGLIFFVAGNSPREFITIMNGKTELAETLKAIEKTADIDKRVKKYCKNFDEKNPIEESLKIAKFISEAMIPVDGVINHWLEFPLRLSIFEELPLLTHKQFSRVFKLINKKAKARVLIEMIPAPTCQELNWIKSQREAQRICLEALLFPLRQRDIESCYSTSVSIKVQKEGIPFLTDCIEIMRTGALRRKDENKIHTFPLRMPKVSDNQNPLFLEMYDILMAQMGALKTKEDLGISCFKTIHYFLTTLDNSYAEPIQKYLFAFKKYFNDDAHWFFDEKEKTKSGGRGKVILYHKISDFQGFIKVTSSPQFQALLMQIHHKAFQNIRALYNNNTLLNRIFVIIDMAIRTGNFETHFNSISQLFLLCNGTLDPVWAIEGGFENSVLASYYELDRSHLIKETVIGDKGQDVSQALTEVLSLTPPSLLEKHLITSDTDHAFCAIPKKVAEKEMGYKETRLKEITYRKEITYKNLRKVGSIPIYFNADNPIRTLITNVALKNGGLLNEKVETTKNAINEHAFKRAFEDGKAMTAFPCFNTNHIEVMPIHLGTTNETEEHLHTVYQGIDIDVTEERFRMGRYVKISDAENANFTQEDPFTNFTIYFA